MSPYGTISRHETWRYRTPVLAIGATWRVLAFGALALYAQGAQAASVQSETAPIVATAQTNVVEPESLAALGAMGDYLSTLKSFGLKSIFSAELVLDNDQNVQIGGAANYVVQRPNRLHVDLATDLGERSFVYDGKTLYVISPKENVFGAVEVGSNIKEMLETAAYHLGIELPLADLFDWGTADAPVNAVLEGFLVGAAQVDGVDTKHWAFRTAEKDFQVWIQEGQQPLPVKLVIEDNTQEGRPTFQANLAWNLEQEPTEADFTYTPSADASQIDFLELAGTEETAK